MSKRSSKKHEREQQYEQIKENAIEPGVSDQRAEEVAARAAHGGKTRSGSQGPTRDQLYEEARLRGIEGRSSMTKDQLRRALGDH
ncbi:plasmid stabilization protein [Streptomyces sp. NPDC005573]|uniref:plasmid stabilization protein n=1 Tax=Streptomyces sp. NPDC005573 TaxID=3156890 RepID=UPI0033B08C0F